MDATLEWDEARWAQALLDRYFSPSFANEPVTFCVDDDELASICGAPAGDAVASLTRAVRRELMPQYCFERVQRRARMWEVDGFEGPPPSLPILAVAVLAATRMVVHEQGGAPNYYRAFRHLLDPQDTGLGEPSGYGRTMPYLWNQLSRWLGHELGGRRGTPTITRHEHFTNIGYALQQAVLRTSDRRRLHRFLKAIGFEPGDEVATSELRRALAIYARRLGPPGSRLLRIATDPSIEVYADDLLRRVAEGWDGRLHDPRTGAPELRLCVLLSQRPATLGLVVMRDDDDPDALVLTDDDATISLSSRGAYYDPAPLGLDAAEALVFGAELTGPVRGAAFDPEPVVPLAWDDDLAAWLSCDRISNGEPHVLLVAPDVRNEVHAWLTAELGGAPALDAGATDALPPGWCAYRGVRLETRPERPAPEPIADLLGSAGGARTRLVGGLGLPGLTRTYLVDGLPVLAFPAHAESAPFSLHLGGYPPIPLRAEASQYPLNLLNLGPATYRISHEHGSLDLDVVDGISESPGKDVGSVTATRSDGRSCRGLRPSFPSPARPHVVPVIGTSTCAVLGPSHDDVALVEVPRWMDDVAGPFAWSTTDVWCGFTPVWCLELGGATSLAHLLQPQEPAGGGAGSSWARLLACATLDPRDSAASTLWDRYRQAATT